MDDPQQPARCFTTVSHEMNTTPSKEIEQAVLVYWR